MLLIAQSSLITTNDKLFLIPLHLTSCPRIKLGTFERGASALAVFEYRYHADK